MYDFMVWSDIIPSIILFILIAWNPIETDDLHDLHWPPHLLFIVLWYSSKPPQNIIWDMTINEHKTQQQTRYCFWNNDTKRPLHVCKHALKMCLDVRFTFWTSTLCVSYLKISSKMWLSTAWGQTCFSFHRPVT